LAMLPIRDTLSWARPTAWAIANGYLEHSSCCLHQK
jgi:hypothetical protein